MPSENEIRMIIENFMENAGPEERSELEQLLQQRKNRQGLSGQIGPSPRDMANRISGQMGLSTEQIKNSARELVAQMVLQYDPNISNAKLAALTELFVSGGHAAKSLPPELLSDMIVHFIDYSLGRMPQHILAELPEGWTEKYWHNFPENIQKLIAALIKENISENEFWKAVKKEFP